MPEKFKAIAVYCGSRTGRNAEFAEAARELGRVLAARNIRLIYGGGRIGLMGEVAREVIAHGGRVMGVIPEFMVDLELALTDGTELVKVSSMHERKLKMAELADGFIALPGGFGTLEEILEVITWNQLGIINKPCGFLNCNGYFDSFFAFLDEAVRHDFIKGKHRNRTVTSDNPEELLANLGAVDGEYHQKW